MYTTDILLTFEVPTLTVDEADATRQVAVIKQDGMVTERDLTVRVINIPGTASLGKPPLSCTSQSVSLFLSHTIVMYATLFKAADCRACYWYPLKKEFRTYPLS